MKLGLLADSRSFLANQKARNKIVGAENLLKRVIKRLQKNYLTELSLRLGHQCYFLNGKNKDPLVILHKIHDKKGQSSHVYLRFFQSSGHVRYRVKYFA